MVNVSQQIEIATENFLDEQFETVSHKTEYPYGRHRGDERIQTVYQRKDGNLISDSDMEVILARDLDSEVNICKKNSQTLVFCQILGWGKFLL